MTACMLNWCPATCWICLFWNSFSVNYLAFSLGNPLSTKSRHCSFSLSSLDAFVSFSCCLPWLAPQALRWMEVVRVGICVSLGLMVSDSRLSASHRMFAAHFSSALYQAKPLDLSVLTQSGSVNDHTAQSFEDNHTVCSPVCPLCLSVHYHHVLAGRHCSLWS